MKTNFLPAILLFVSLSVSAQIPNHSFEKWHLGASLNYEEPDDWNTDNQPISSFFTDFPVLKTTDAAEDSFAVLMQSKFYALIAQSLPGILTTAAISINLVTYEPIFSGGLDFAARPESIKFKYKFEPTGPDTATAYIFLLDIDTALGTTDTIGTSGWRFTDTLTTYDEANVTIKYLNGNMPNTLVLTFSSATLGSVTAGSKFFVDEVEVEWFTGFKTPLFSEKKVNVYPNPAQNFIHIVVPSFKEGYSINTYDILGHRIVNYKLSSGMEILDMSNYQNGIYFFELVGQNGKLIETGKINIVK